MAADARQSFRKDVNGRSITVCWGALDEFAASVDERLEHVVGLGSIGVASPCEGAQSECGQVEPAASALLQFHASSLAESAPATARVGAASGEWFHQTADTASARHTSYTKDSCVV